MAEGPASRRPLLFGGPLCPALSALQAIRHPDAAPGEYHGRNSYAVYFADPDGMKLEGLIWAPPAAKRKPVSKKKTRARKF
jgi:hypothetical protein